MQTTLFETPPVKEAGSVPNVQIPTNAVGKVFLTNTGEYFNVSLINPQTIQKYSVNPYYVTKRTQLTHQIFNGPPKYEIFKPTWEIDEELSTIAARMCENLVDWDSPGKMGRVDMYQHAQSAFGDMFDGGASIFEPIWANYNGFAFLYSLNRLPWETFRMLPMGVDKSPSIMLKGVVLNSAGEIEYHQYQDDDQFHLIPNIFHMKNPTSRDLAGDALSIPVIPVIQILDFLWDVLRRKSGRVGVPSIFVECLQGDPDTVMFADEIIKNWGNSIQFKHNENIRVYTLDFKDGGGVEEAIKSAECLLDSLYNPAILLEKSGTVIGGSDAGAERLINTQSNTMLSWLDMGFSSLLQKWLDINMFLGYTAKVTFPKAEPDKTKENVELCKVGYETKTVARSERRELLKRPPASPEIEAELDEEFGVPTADPALLGNVTDVATLGAPKGKFGNAAQNKSMFDRISDRTDKELLSLEDEFSKRLCDILGVTE